MKNQRGLTVIASLFTLILMALIVWTAFYAYDAYWVSTRFPCYDNQKAIDHVLWRTNKENKREMIEVVTAYAIRYPDSRPPVLVVLYAPKPPVSDHEVVVVDLSKDISADKVVCPLRGGTYSRPVIDYWFAFGRWHCLHNKWHSQ